MAWMGIAAAVSPLILTSALRIGPQAVPSTNCVHAPSGLPEVLLTVGKDKVIALSSTRRPDEPVSTRTCSIDWQVLVPGLHRVTVTNKPLT